MNLLLKRTYPVFKNKAEDAGSHLEEENDGQEYGILSSETKIISVDLKI